MYISAFTFNFELLDDILRSRIIYFYTLSVCQGNDMMLGPSEYLLNKCYWSSLGHKDSTEWTFVPIRKR